ncbi:MAG: DUF859 family phage minor structural protein [Desulfosporosinus sp.]|jgi:hypothetical protein
MALSGSFQNLPVNNFGLYCTWSATQSVTGNYSDVTLNVYLKYYTLEVGSRADSTISINGVSETYTAPAITDYSSGQHTKLLKTKTVRVNHNADGTKSGVALSAYWRFSGTYSGTPISSITASTTITLDTIDRTAPTVSLSTSSITASGVTISATSSATSDIWQYSIDNGSTWTQFSTTAGTSASKAITGLSPNTTYYIKVKARKKSNQVYGTSSAATVKTLGGAIVNSVNQVTADAATVSIKLNVTVYDASYAYTLALKNGSTTIVSVDGLTWSKGTADRTVVLTSSERTELLTAMANMKSFTGTFAVTTYNGSTQIGSVSSKTATVTTTAANSGPTLSGFTFADSYATTTAITGNDQLFIQGHSKLTVTPGTATPKNQATITNYTATCNGVSVSNTTGAALTVGPVSKSGTVAVVLTITDSRGYTASVTQNITVLAYAKPKVNSLTLRRTNDIEAEMQLVFNGSISAITVDSVQKNSLLYVRYRYKATSATSYSSYVSILSAVTQNGTSFSYSNLELRSLASDQSWDVHIQIRDQLNSLSSLDLYYVIPQGTPLVALRKQKVGINTPTPEAALDVVGDAKVSGTLTATTLSGALAPSKLSSAVPISKGGTGATTAAAARTNLAVLPLAGGTLTGKVTSTYGDIGIVMQHGTASKDCGVSMKRTDTEVQMFVGVGTGGVNHGVYSNKLGKWLIYGNGTDVICNGTATNVTGTVAIGHGGTGATTAAAARTNLGITCTSLYNGSLSSGSITFNYGNYNAYLILGQPGSATAIAGIVVPKGMITTSDVKYQITDESYYRCFNLKYSGSTVTLTISTGSGTISRVFGLT